MRYLTRIVTPDDYDTAVRLQPETCPMHYMGDRRTGHKLLAEADADAAITVAALPAIWQLPAAAAKICITTVSTLASAAAGICKLAEGGGCWRGLQGLWAGWQCY